MEKSLKTEMTKEKILNSATEEFALHGFDGATVNQICQKHNISKGLIYHNFENKEALYVCCVAQAVQAFISYMEPKSFGCDFRLYMQERYEFFRAHPQYSRLIFGMILTDNSVFSEKIKSIKSRFDEFNRNIYVCALNTIQLRKGVMKEDALQYYSLLQNMLNSYLSCDGASAENFDFVVGCHEKSLEKILDFMLYGIAEEKSV